MCQGQDEAGLGQGWCGMDPGWDGATVKGPGLAVGCRRKHVLPDGGCVQGCTSECSSLQAGGWLREDGAQPAAFPASLLV